jgi:hypothetical protein
MRMDFCEVVRVFSRTPPVSPQGRGLGWAPRTATGTRTRTGAEVGIALVVLGKVQS